VGEEKEEERGGDHDNDEIQVVLILVPLLTAEIPPADICWREY
jgi:hypothetical protein